MEDGGNAAGGIYDLRFAIYGSSCIGTAAQTPLNVTTPGNAVAPTQTVDTGSNPLGNVGY